MNVPLLFVGKAYDGPVGAPVAPMSIDEAMEVFGGYVYENQTISATCTGFTTSTNVNWPITFMEWKDEDLQEFTNISGIAISGTSVTFERLGIDKNLVVKYVRDMPSGCADVYKAYAESYMVANVIPHLYRVGGTPASAQITSDGTGIQLTTTGAGSLYNQASITISTSGLTLQQPPGKGADYTFSITNLSIDDVRDAINLRYMKGYGCIICESIGSGLFSIPPGTYSFSSGSDGNFTDQELIDLFADIDLSGICTISILGKTYPIVGSPGVLGQILTNDFLDNVPNPIMFVQGVAYVSGMSEDTYITYLEDNKPITHKNAMLVVGWGSFYDEIHPGYTDNLATSIAPYIVYSQKSLYWTDVGLGQIAPIFSQDGISRLKAAGYAVIGTHYSRNNPIIVSDVASDPDWSSREYVAVMDTIASVKPYMDTLLGTRPVDAANVQSAVLSIMASIPNLQEYSADVTIYRNGTIYAALMIRPYASIANITFSIAIQT